MLFHGHTQYGKRTVAAAHATLDIFEQDDVLNGLSAKVDHLRDELARPRTT